MLIIRNGNIEYDISHLTSNKMTDYEEIIERYKNMSTRLFYNIVSAPNCKYENRLGTERINSEFKNMTSEERFKNILKKGLLIGNPKSYFVNKHGKNLTTNQLNEICSVSFTFAEFDELPRHFKARNSEFGICFFGIMDIFEAIF